MTACPRLSLRLRCQAQRRGCRGCAITQVDGRVRFEFPTARYDLTYVAVHMPMMIICTEAQERANRLSIGSWFGILPVLF